MLLCFENYLFIPLSKVFLEKLTGFQLVKTFPTFYGTRRFITTFTSVRYLSLSWGRGNYIHKILANIMLWIFGL